MKIRVAEKDDLKNIANLHIKSWRLNYTSVLTAEYLDKEIERDRIAVWSERLTNSLANKWYSLQKSAVTGLVFFKSCWGW